MNSFKCGETFSSREEYQTGSVKKLNVKFYFLKGIK